MTSMSTLDNEFRIRWSLNGNTYAVEEKKVPADAKGKEWSGWFALDETGSLIIGDTHGRILHGYLDTIQSLGISRVRLHGADQISKSAWPVMFAATIPESRNTSSVALATQNPTMIISDVEGNLYFPIICVYKSEKVFPKQFMANSTDDGIPTLMGNSAAILENMTGEEVQECGFMTWTNFHTGQSIIQILECDILASVGYWVEYQHNIYTEIKQADEDSGHRLLAKERKAMVELRGITWLDLSAGVGLSNNVAIPPQMTNAIHPYIKERPDEVSRRFPRAYCVLLLVRTFEVTRLNF
ncbi:hypothetical protein DL98DRAFT_537333 [Cadophora sp. DSE1049]|nr:hypothetical protein DL98DRAFT_537333 [Cadophora sp. DSE1049]